MLYLHEIIEIIGTGQESYLKTVGERARHSEEKGISRLMGTWKVIGSTGRWPQVVNLWEMDGWEHWAATLERQFLPEKVDRDLAPWWAKATEWRRGGFDRILEPASYSPSRAQLRAGSLRAWVCAHTITKMRPGNREQFLAMFPAHLQPLLERRGLTLLGAYAVPMRGDEVVTIWAAPDFQTLCRVYDGWSGDSDLVTWERRVAPLRETYETMWLVPSVDCFFHPNHRP